MAQGASNRLRVAMTHSLQVLRSMLFPVCLSVLAEFMVAAPLMRRPDQEQRSSSHVKTSYTQLDELMKATPLGVCMYALPAKFNINLVDSTFQQPERAAKAITRKGTAQLLEGTHDTDEFSLDRVFYDRMLEEATGTLRPEQCKLFYIPYFNQWETSHFGWLATNTKDRSKLDKELLSYLKHFGRFRKPSGIDHIMTLSRVERDCHLAKNPDLKHMTLFGIESGMYNNSLSYISGKKVQGTKRSGGNDNVRAIPYPTWFRFEKNDVAQRGLEVTMTSAIYKIYNYNTGDACGHVSASDFMAKACASKTWCAIQVPVEVQGCHINELRGTYRCNGASEQFEFHAKVVSWVHGVGQSAVVNRGQSALLGCRRGPCWVWGDCHKPIGEERTGPLVAFVGSERQWDEEPKANDDHEREPLRYKSMEDCNSRPLACVLIDTGSRTYRVSDFESEKILAMNELLMASVFCLNPPGDTPTRKGSFDSLLAGCIPVIFEEASLSMYEWHLPNWEDVSVYIPPDVALKPGFNIVDHLASLSLDEVRSKQTSIQNVAFSLQYSTTRTSGTPWHMDAFDVAMSKALDNVGVAKVSMANPSSSDHFLASGLTTPTTSNQTRQIRKHTLSSITTGANGDLTHES